MEVLCRETPDFISPDLWPPNSPDLNPVDYEICEVIAPLKSSDMLALYKLEYYYYYYYYYVMQRHVYQRKIHTIDELKQRLIEVWCGLDQSTVNMAIDQWRKKT